MRCRLLSLYHQLWKFPFIYRQDRHTLIGSRIIRCAFILSSCIPLATNYSLHTVNQHPIWHRAYENVAVAYPENETNDSDGERDGKRSTVCGEACYYNARKQSSVFVLAIRRNHGIDLGFRKLHLDSSRFNLIRRVWADILYRVRRAKTTSSLNWSRRSAEQHGELTSLVLSLNACRKLILETQNRHSLKSRHQSRWAAAFFQWFIWHTHVLPPLVSTVC